MHAQRGGCPPYTSAGSFQGSQGGRGQPHREARGHGGVPHRDGAGQGEQLMTPSLEKKVATMLSYQDELFSGHRESNRAMMRSMLDDPEVAQWLDHARQNGGIDHTRFSGAPNTKR